MSERILPFRRRNTQAAEQAADEAIARVWAGASAEWINSATQAARQVAERLEFFTTDDVDDELSRRGTPRASEPRALGAVMRELATTGVAEATMTYEKSKSTICHARPKRVWRSLVIRPGRARG